MTALKLFLLIITASLVLPGCSDKPFNYPESLREQINALEGDFVTAYIANPQLSPDNLYLAVAEEFGVEVDAQSGSHHVLKCLNEKLINFALNEKKVVLVIDEAQAMPEATIEALRLLTNLETESAKLLQVVLFGQPELDELLRRPSLRQLQQRITFQHRILPLDKGASDQYVQHRLAQAGYNGPVLFERSASKLLFRASGGIPRLINILAHKSMMSAYGRGDRQVLRKHVKLAIQDTESVSMPAFFGLSWAFSGLCILGVAGASSLIVLGGMT